MAQDLYDVYHVGVTVALILTEHTLFWLLQADGYRALLMLIIVYALYRRFGGRRFGGRGGRSRRSKYDTLRLASGQLGNRWRDAHFGLIRTAIWWMVIAIAIVPCFYMDGESFHVVHGGAPRCWLHVVVHGRVVSPHVTTALPWAVTHISSCAYHSDKLN